MINDLNDRDKDFSRLIYSRRSGNVNSAERTNAWQVTLHINPTSVADEKKNGQNPGKIRGVDIIAIRGLGPVGNIPCDKRASSEGVHGLKALVFTMKLVL